MKGFDMNYTVISRDLINAIKFRQFDETDYYGFSGVEIGRAHVWTPVT